MVPVGLHPEWLTIPPDGKSLYVAVAGKDATVVVDNKTMKVVKTIPVGVGAEAERQRHAADGLIGPAAEEPGCFLTQRFAESTRHRHR